MIPEWFNTLEQYKEIPNGTEHMCYACGPNNEIGLKMRFFTDEQSVYSKIYLPEEYCGWETIVHGGIQTTLLDETMSKAAIYLNKRFILTKSFTVDFLHPVYVNNILYLEGNIKEKINDRKVVMQAALYDQTGKQCTQCTGLFALFTREAVEKLNIVDPKRIQGFIDLLGVQ